MMIAIKNGLTFVCMLLAFATSFASIEADVLKNSLPNHLMMKRGILNDCNTLTCMVSTKRTNPNYFHVMKIPRGGRGYSNYWNGNGNGNENVETRLLSTLKHIPIHIRGGAIKNPAPTIAKTRTGTSKETETKTKSTFFFPISRSEFPHFLSMSSMMFLFIYVFTTVRDTKDTLVVSNCGAEAIPFLKLYGVMPCAFLFIFGYSRLSQLVGKKALFYLTLCPFFAFYALFAFVLFPNRESIHFSKDIVTKSAAGKAAYSLIQYWSYSLYFIVSELWASAGVPLLFWQIANDVTPMHQAKRFYPLFAVIGNLAPIVSGKVMSYIISLQKTSDDVGFGLTLKKLAMVKSGICIGIIVLYNIVYSMKKDDGNNDIATSSNNSKMGTSIVSKTIGNKVEIKIQRKNRKEVSSPPTPPTKKKPSLSESMKELSTSKELKAMATMVFCYNTCIELTEVLWKGILRQSYPNKSEYMAYMAAFSQTVGIIALLLQLSASTIISKLGWKWAASLTPLTMVILAVPFFTSVVMTMGNKTSGMKGMTLATALAIGTWQNIASKVTKYSLFDPCKEMAYIPLGPEAKTKGKAAVDVLGARLGRSMGSATQQILVLFFGNGSILNCAPQLSVVYSLTVAYWMRAVRILSLLFDGDEGASGGKTKKKRIERD